MYCLHGCPTRSAFRVNSQIFHLPKSESTRAQVSLTDMFRSPRVVLSAFILSLVTTGTTGILYEDALDLARKNQVNQHESSILAAFKGELQLAERSADPIRLRNIKVNLASLLLLLANKKDDPELYLPMYKESSKLSKEVLELDVSCLRKRSDHLRYENYDTMLSSLEIWTHRTT